MSSGRGALCLPRGAVRGGGPAGAAPGRPGSGGGLGAVPAPHRQRLAGAGRGLAGPLRPSPCPGGGGAAPWKLAPALPGLGWAAPCRGVGVPQPRVPGGERSAHRWGCPAARPCHGSGSASGKHGSLHGASLVVLLTKTSILEC